MMCATGDFFLRCSFSVTSKMLHLTFFTISGKRRAIGQKFGVCTSNLEFIPYLAQFDPLHKRPYTHEVFFWAKKLVHPLPAHGHGPLHPDSSHTCKRDQYWSLHIQLQQRKKLKKFKRHAQSCVLEKRMMPHHYVSKYLAGGHRMNSKAQPTKVGNM
jgi:hypothetical protein